MSLYACIDLIDYQLIHLNNEEEQSVADHVFLINLKEQLKKRITEDNYSTFSADIKLIENYLSENQYTQIKNCLRLILDDLKAMERWIGLNKPGVLRPEVRSDADSPENDF